MCASWPRHDATGISASTLSRLESGNRRPQLELLMPLARLSTGCRLMSSSAHLPSETRGSTRVRESGTASSRCRCPAAPGRGMPSNRCIRRHRRNRSGNGSTRDGTGST
ncbi:helix-turn-helix transcriptional regulator [Nonomuraea wenchangensis]